VALLHLHDQTDMHEDLFYDGDTKRNIVNKIRFSIKSWIGSTIFLGCVVFLSKNLDNLNLFLGSSDCKIFKIGLNLNRLFV
jgi:hypothetical protein